MSSNKEKEGNSSNTVFIEGQQVVTTSPYEQYRNVNVEYVTENLISNQSSKKKKGNDDISLECLKLSIIASKPSDQPSVYDIIKRAKRFYQFVKTGE